MVILGTQYFFHSPYVIHIDCSHFKSNANTIDSHALNLLLSIVYFVLYFRRTDDTSARNIVKSEQTKPGTDSDCMYFHVACGVEL